MGWDGIVGNRGDQPIFWDNELIIIIHNCGLKFA
jgi:hypothetical protein